MAWKWNDPVSTLSPEFVFDLSTGSPWEICFAAYEERRASASFMLPSFYGGSSYYDHGRLDNGASVSLGGAAHYGYGWQDWQFMQSGILLMSLGGWFIKIGSSPLPDPNDPSFYWFPWPNGISTSDVTVAAPLYPTPAPSASAFAKLTSWPSADGCVRKCPREISSVNAAYSSGKTIYRSKGNYYFGSNSAYGYVTYPNPAAAPATYFVTGIPVSVARYGPYFAEPAADGQIARLVISDHDQVADAAAVPPVPTLAATPTTDYPLIGQCFKRVSGQWVSDPGPADIITDGALGSFAGDYFGPWLVADFNSMLNQMTSTVTTAILYSDDGSVSRYYCVNDSPAGQSCATDFYVVRSTGGGSPTYSVSIESTITTSATPIISAAITDAVYPNSIVSVMAVRRHDIAGGYHFTATSNGP